MGRQEHIQFHSAELPRPIKCSPSDQYTFTFSFLFFLEQKAALPGETYPMDFTHSLMELWESIFTQPPGLGGFAFLHLQPESTQALVFLLKLMVKEAFST